MLWPWTAPSTKAATLKNVVPIDRNNPDTRPSGPCLILRTICHTLYICYHKRSLHFVEHLITSWGSGQPWAHSRAITWSPHLMKPYQNISEWKGKVTRLITFDCFLSFFNHSEQIRLGLKRWHYSEQPWLMTGSGAGCSNGWHDYRARHGGVRDAESGDQLAKNYYTGQKLRYCKSIYYIVCRTM